jgi:hypothetical protein
MAQRSVIELWDDVFAAWAAELLRDGLEPAILLPLAQRPAGALRIVGHLRGSAGHEQRKIAAMLAGFLGPRAPANLLDELFEAEAARDRTAPESERFDTQSVVEEVVFAATRWCRHLERKPAALALLTKVVERTMAGEYWNTSSYAMAGLVHHGAPGAPDLLARFAAFASGPAPEHPSRPSLGQERAFAEALGRGQSDQIEKLLARAETDAARVTWDDDATAAIDELLDAAKRER